MKIENESLLDTLNRDGVAIQRGVLSPAQCSELRALYDEPSHFRSRVIMQRHGYGRGEYQYFSDPLPGLVQQLREQWYAPLAPLANDWSQRMHRTRPFPPDHASYRAACHAAGQTRPTPLLLRYREGDYNCLHQDLYGEQVFPLQLVVLLSRPNEDFDGGELVLTEQRPRMQSRPRVISLQQGDAAVFAVAQRPVAGTRGDYRVAMRHGVGTVHRGERFTLGVIFHDAA
jgi:hypothetical protein